MIKAVGRNGGGTPVVLLGLTGENMTRLMADEPILVDLADLNLPSLKIVLIGGRDEAAIRDQLSSAMDASTVIHEGPGDGS